MIYLSSYTHVYYIYIYMYIYIYIERERERKIHILICIFIFIYLFVFIVIYPSCRASPHLASQRFWCWEVWFRKLTVPPTKNTNRDWKVIFWTEQIIFSKQKKKNQERKYVLEWKIKFSKQIISFLEKSRYRMKNPTPERNN